MNYDQVTAEYMQEVKDYLRQVGTIPGEGRRVAGNDPLADRFSQQAEDQRQARALGVPYQTDPRLAQQPTYDTYLNPTKEAQFQAWKAQYAPRDSGQDYDLRGAFKAGLKPDAATGHWPDTFKKPGHPTFSDESKYARFGNPGHWQGDTYTPGTPQPTTGQSPQYGFTPTARPAWAPYADKVGEVLGDPRMNALMAPGMPLLKAPGAAYRAGQALHRALQAEKVPMTRPYRGESTQRTEVPDWIRQERKDSGMFKEKEYLDGGGGSLPTSEMYGLAKPQNSTQTQRGAYIDKLYGLNSTAAMEANTAQPGLQAFAQDGIERIKHQDPMLWRDIVAVREGQRDLVNRLLNDASSRGPRGGASWNIPEGKQQSGEMQSRLFGFGHTTGEN